MAAATFDMNDLKRRMQGALGSLKHELSGLRTGRASTALLENVQVDAYGTHMPLNQLATISVPEPRLLNVQVWDHSMVHAVEKAISAANLGLSPSTEGQNLRLRIPELNEERRRELVKVAHKYSESARVAVRHVRRDGLDLLKKMEKDHQISEDEHKHQASEVQKVTDATIAEVEKMLAGKEKEDHDGLSDAASISKATQPRTAADGGFEVPRHVAIIMDGNGRWASARGLPRVEGHRRGVEALRKTVRAASELGISVLTIFAFSSENWSRPQSEIGDLLLLLRRFIRNDLVDLHKSNVRVRVIGEREDLSKDIRGLLDEAENLTRENDGLLLVVAFNYGARQEIARAARRLAMEVAQGRLKADDITPELLTQHLDAPEVPDPDVIIRTSGEQRLSNFLLWQSAYSELVFVPVNWPDFDRAALETAIAEYRRRERRFGGLIAQTAS